MPFSPIMINMPTNVGKTVDMAMKTEDFAQFEKFIEKGQVKGITKTKKPEFEDFAKNYINDEPEILFVAEYVVEDKFVGTLIVWEKYFDSTHYEIFKKNLFQSNSGFERILFLDVQSLEEEKNHFIDYLKNTLGFDEIENENICIVLDDKIKEDRIYEYRIIASRVPKDFSEVDYDMILESKKMLGISTLDRSSTMDLFSFAGSSLGSKDLAWIVSLLNKDVVFFGRTAIENPIVNSISEFDNDIPKILIPKNADIVLNIIKESFSLFNIKRTMEHLVDVLGGLSLELRNLFLDAIDETENVFSYDKFKKSAEKEMPALNLILDIAESGDEGAVNELSSLSIVVPTNEGSESFSSLDSLSKILKFTNELMLAVLYAQEKETFEKIQEIANRVEREREDSGEDVVEEAVRESREEIANQTEEESSKEVASFFSTTVGSEENEKAEDGNNEVLTGYTVR